VELNGDAERGTLVRGLTTQELPVDGQIQSFAGFYFSLHLKMNFLARGDGVS
jgi:hypothetical protein